jgi:hypothetical protein
MLFDWPAENLGRFTEQEMLQRLSIGARGRRHRIDFGSMETESNGWKCQVYRKLYKRAAETFQCVEEKTFYDEIA